jgi:hypothetical protein
LVEIGKSVYVQVVDEQALSKAAVVRLKMAEGSDLSQHINIFNKIISDLKRVDVKFEDEDKALFLLNSLPTSNMYENLVTTLTWAK